jgi:hypothetical protein
LLRQLHAVDMRLILDLVPNHTSDQHQWVKESRSSRTNAKRSWYVWADPAPNGGLPNNWLSRFGGSAWTWDESTDQYYYHAFLQGAAGPQLAQSGGARGNGRGDAFLAAPGGRRLPHGCRRRVDRGRLAAGRSSRPPMPG